MYNVAFTAETHARLWEENLQRDLEARQLRRVAREARDTNPSQVSVFLSSVPAKGSRFLKQRAEAITALFTPTNEPEKQCC